MNLFILDKHPEIAAQYNNDKHVRKIILEAVEMMGYTYDRGEFKALPNFRYNGRHLNHPMSLWVRNSRQNFDWTLRHTYGLLDEFTHRFGKEHAYRKVVDWIAFNLPIDNLPNSGQTDWPRCFAEWKDIIGQSDDAVYDYRQYYIKAKKHLATWTKREQPFWWRYDSNA